MAVRFPWSANLILGAALMLALIGCGGAPTATVSGKVTYQTKPIPKGTIAFVDEKGAVVYGNIVDGNYTAEKVPVGKVTVGVVSIGGGGVKAPAGVAEKYQKNVPAGVSVDFKKAFEQHEGITIPKHYEDPAKSGLTFDVVPGEQKKDFDLK